MTTTVATDQEPDSSVRVDVLALPSPTTVSFAMLVVALLTAGLFVGNSVHNATPAGEAWARTHAQCVADAPASSAANPRDALVERQATVQACTADVEQRRAAYALAGAVTAAVAGVVLVFLAPAEVRRRRRLRPVGPAFGAAERRLEQLADEAGVTPVPLLETGQASQRDAFSYGRPGCYRVALPKAVAARATDRDVFDPVVRHELAHIAHHDVPLAWFARSLWVAVLPLLSIPVVVGLARGDRSVLLEYSWRAVLLAAVVLLVRRSALREREVDADLRSVAGVPGGVAQLEALLGQVRSPGERWSGLLANHPTAADRRAQVARPQLAARSSWSDGLSAGVLAGLSFDLLLGLLTTAFAPAGGLALARVVTSVTVGALLGATVGLAVWRQVLVERLDADPRPPLPVAAGVAAGLVLGRVASLAAVGATPETGVPSWASVVVLAAVGFGGTLATASAAHVWADDAPAHRSARSFWMPGVLFSGALFAGALWLEQLLREAVEAGGWVLGGALLLTPTESWLPAMAFLACSTVVLVRTTRRATGGEPAPSWLLETPPVVPWPRQGPLRGRVALGTGVFCGAVGAASLALYGWAAGPATGQEHVLERVALYLLLSLGAALAAAASLCLLDGRRGPAGSFVAAPLAVVTTVVGVVVLELLQGGRLDRALLEIFLRPPLTALWFLVPATAGLAAVGAARRTGRPQRRHVVAVTVPVLASSLLLAVPLAPALTLDVAMARSETELQELNRSIEVLTYGTGLVPEVLERYATQVETAQAVLGDDTLDAAESADVLETGPLAELEVLLADLRSRTVSDVGLRAAHEQLLLGMDLEIQGLRAYTVFLRTEDPELLARGRELRLRGGEHLIEWRRLVELRVQDVME